MKKILRTLGIVTLSLSSVLFSSCGLYKESYELPLIKNSNVSLSVVETIIEDGKEYGIVEIENLSDYDSDANLIYYKRAGKERCISAGVDSSGPYYSSILPAKAKRRFRLPNCKDYSLDVAYEPYIYSYDKKALAKEFDDIKNYSVLKYPGEDIHSPDCIVVDDQRFLDSVKGMCTVVVGFTCQEKEYTFEAGYIEDGIIRLPILYNDGDDVSVSEVKLKSVRVYKNRIKRSVIDYNVAALVLLIIIPGVSIITGITIWLISRNNKKSKKFKKEVNE